MVAGDLANNFPGRLAGIVRSHGVQEPQRSWVPSFECGPSAQRLAWNAQVAEALCLRQSRMGCIKQLIEPSGGWRICQRKDERCCDDLRLSLLRLWWPSD